MVRSISARPKGIRTTKFTKYIILCAPQFQPGRLELMTQIPKDEMHFQ